MRIRLSDAVLVSQCWDDGAWLSEQGARRTGRNSYEVPRPLAQEILERLEGSPAASDYGCSEPGEKRAVRAAIKRLREVSQ